MFQSKVLSLIAEGENERIEFKRELMLDTAERKAEFIKDIVALGNSASGSAYLLIGVDDGKEVVGIEKLGEERIQQIVSAYIDPPAVMRCASIQVQADPPLQVGVIEVRPTGKPHKVARSIGRLSQNDVFVRHGSVVEKASPEEIVRMHQTSRLEAEKNQFVKAAETHLGLDNLAAAIKVYSNAIEIFPIAELFLARGRTYYKQWQKEREHFKRKRGSETHDELYSRSGQTASSLLMTFQMHSS